MQIKRAHRINVTLPTITKSFWVSGLPLPAALVDLIRDTASESVTWTCPEPAWRAADCVICDALHNLLGEAQDND